VPSIFFSYSHEDEALRDELEKHLSLLKREGIIDVWHDRRITAGEHIHNAIDRRITEDDIIVLLVSPAFINSNYCFDIELKRAMERHGAGEAVVIPVILRPCDWQTAPFGNLMAVPRDGRAITKWPNQDEAFLDVVVAIRKVAKELAARRPAQTAAAPVTATDATRAKASSPAGIPAGPRSSNLRLAKTFTQRDKDRFLSETFDYIALYFENSLNELAARNPGFEGVFKRIDASRFSGTIYRNGDAASRGTVFLGGTGGFGGGINYAMGETHGANSFNESLSVESDDQTMFMKSLGMASYGQSREQKLSMEGAAETLWSILIEPLQSRR
jgi:hypothetical protein